MNTIETIEATQLRERPDLRPGVTVRVHVKIREGEKQRIQVFEGIVIGIRRGGPRGTFTVRSRSGRVSSVFFRCTRRPSTR